MTSHAGQVGNLRPIGNRRSNPEPERGFALLFVLLTASLIAISLYIELPRIAFETQRNREQLLVDRGHQYQRAVQLFVRANKRYPSKMEDLESFNDKRYLRHRFIDPLTMKDDWRLVHVGPTGMLTDSLVPKNNLNSNNPLGGKDQNKDQSASATGTGTGTPDPNDPNNPNNPGVGLVSMKGARPSDTMVHQLPPMGSNGAGAVPVSDPSGQAPPVIDPTTGLPYAQPGQPNPGQPNPGQPGQPYPGQYPVQPGQPYPGQPGAIQPGQPYPVGVPGQPGAIQPGTIQPGVIQPGQPYPVGVPVTPGQPYPSPGQPYPSPGQPYPGQPGQPYPGQPYVQPGQPYPVPGQPYPQPVNQPGQPYPGQPYPGQPYPGSVPGPGQYNPAVIQPNPQFPPQGNTAATNPGLAAVQQAILNPAARQSSFANPGQQQQGFGGGIAGVGVPAEIKGSGIMVVKDRSKYREWEFIYDPKEDKNVVGAAAANMNAAGGPGGLSGVTPQTPTKP